MSVSTTVKKFGIEQAIKYMYKDPDKNLVNLMDWADKFSKGEFEPQRKPSVMLSKIQPIRTMHLSVT